MSPALKELADKANAQELQRRKDASLAAFTPGRATADAAEALPGILDDLFGNTQRKSVLEVFTRKNRLRGLGWVLVLVAALGMCIYVALHLKMEVTTKGSSMGWSTAAPPSLAATPVYMHHHPSPPPPPPLFKPGEGFAFAR